MDPYMNSYGSFEQPADDGHHKAGLAASIFNLANAAIGAGVLALPSALKSLGLYGGIATLTVTGMGSFWTLSLLAQCMGHAGVTTYEDAAEYYFKSKKAKDMVKAFIMIMTLGAQTVFLQILGDSLPPALDAAFGSFLGSDSWFLSRFGVTLLVTVFLLFPLSMLRSTRALAPSSFLSILAMIYITAVLVYHAISDPAPVSEITAIGDASGFLQGVPLCVFAYTCQVMVWPILSDLKDFTPARGRIVSGGAMVLCLVFNVTCAVAGYVAFGNGVSGDVLLSLPEGHVLTLVANSMLALMSTLTYPLQLFAGRKVFFSLVEDLTGHVYGHNPLLAQPSAFTPLKANINSSYMPSESNDIDQHSIPLIEWIPYTLVSLVATVALAVTVPNISSVVAIMGASITVIMVFILPGFLAASLHTPSSKRILGPYPKESLAPLALAVLGIALAFVCSFMVIRGLIQG